MNLRNTLIILTFAMVSCVPDYSGDKKNDIKGLWVTENIQPNFIHANIRFPFTDTSNLEKHRITWNFEIQFNENATFETKEVNGIDKSGTYKLIDDTIILQLKESSHDWLKLTVNSLTSDIMQLQTTRVYLQTMDADTVE
ncbi:MAG: hypothetical protein WBA74_04540, partial [Cyclobacteriaceae bacterium]